MRNLFYNDRFFSPNANRVDSLKEKAGWKIGLSPAAYQAFSFKELRELLHGIKEMLNRSEHLFRKRGDTIY
jgi:hypothetical protein